MKRFFYIFMIGLVAIQPVYGQNLDAYLDMAAEQNPRVKAVFLAYQSALQRVPQVGALPDPQLSMGVFLRPMQQMMGNQVAQISLMQMFPWMGTLDAAKEEAALSAKAKFDAFRDVRSSLFYEVKAIWYALYLIEQERQITAENIKIMHSLETIAVNRFKSGATSGGVSPTPTGKETLMPIATGGKGMTSIASSGQMDPGGAGQEMAMGNNTNSAGKSELVDVLRTQMAILELENELHLLVDSKRVLVAHFNTLLNRAVDTEVEIANALQAPPLPIPVAQFPDSIVANNPILSMLEEEERALFAKKKVNHKMSFPKVGVGVQYGILQPRDGNTNPRNGRDMVMPTVSINLPIWRKKYHAAVQEAEFQRVAVTEEQREMHNTLLVSYEKALRDFEDAERRTGLFKKQTGLAEQALRILIVSYGAGGNAFEDVMEMQLRLLNYRLGLMNAVVDQNVAVAMLERLMGR
jgi:outer membrane protein TolC